LNIPPSHFGLLFRMIERSINPVKRTARLSEWQA
jgi:hypothetical protein